MKFTLALALAGLVSCIGATSLETTRDLQDDRYHIYDDLAVTTVVSGTAFELSANHREADSGTSATFSGLRYIYLFKKCPHGAGPAQASSGNSNFLGKISVTGNSEEQGTQPGWVTTVTPISVSGSGGTRTSKIQFKILPTVSAVSDIWTFASTSSDDKGTAEFCLLFGLGNSAGTPKEIYGFREIVLKAEFVFDGDFTCISFTTQAYDPVTGLQKTSKTYGAAATNCSPLTPVRPGTPACMEVCPSPYDSVTYINTVNEAWMCEQSSTSAPGGFTGIVGPSTAGVPWKVVCDSSDGRLSLAPETLTPIPPSGVDGDGTFGYTANIRVGCCRVIWVLPARYFPTIDAESPPIYNPTTPDVATFNVCGEVDVRPLPLSGPTEHGEHGLGCRGDDCRSRRDAERGHSRELRQLQADETGENGVLGGKLEYYVLPAEASSSRKGAIAGAAAAVGALGAALLI